MFATVWAFNKVGMNVSESSKGFIIDESAPSVRRKPSFWLDGTPIKRNLSQWDRSVLKLNWEFVDQESPITSHVISLLTHHDGHTPIENINIGSEQHFTITLDGENWLNNGDRYVVEVTACNAAGQCSTERTNDFIVDSTPPHMGGVQSHQPNTWRNFADMTNTTMTNISLTWYGFYDQESGIDQYFVTVSRSFYMQELSGGIITVQHNITSHIQTVNITLMESLRNDEMIIVSIWAQNEVGLNSTVSKTTFLTLSHKVNGKEEMDKGTFAIQKHSCDVHSCLKDCTCSVIGKPCVEVEASNLTHCNEIDANGTASQQAFTVMGGLLNQHMSVTTSSACLAGQWYRSDSSNVTVQRYEWGLGVHRLVVGAGIFDLKSESPWHDIGLLQQFVYCLPTNKSLTHKEEYVVYVRAWYDSATYATFASPPIKIDHTPPSVLRGQHIIEGDISCSTDMDFINWTDSIHACWANVFSEQQSTISFYTIGFGTSPNGEYSVFNFPLCPCEFDQWNFCFETFPHKINLCNVIHFAADDIISTTNVGLNVSITFEDVTLQHATKYYFTVTSVNEVGLFSTLASDGFIVDINKPTTSVVFNSAFHRDVRFQSSTTEFTASWHGFQDHCSGVQTYLIALVDDFDANNLIFNNAAFLTSFTFSNVTLVKDAAGHESDVVFSAPVVIDSSAPHGYQCVRFVAFECIVDTTTDEDTVTDSFTINIQKDTIYRIEGSVDNATHVNIVFQLDHLHTPIPVRVLHNGSFDFSYTFVAAYTQRQNISLTFISDGTETLYHRIIMSKCADTIVNDSNAFEVIQLAPDTFVVNVFVIDLDSDVRQVHRTHINFCIMLNMLTKLLKSIIKHMACCDFFTRNSKS